MQSIRHMLPQSQLGDKLHQTDMPPCMRQASSLRKHLQNLYLGHLQVIITLGGVSSEGATSQQITVFRFLQGRCIQPPTDFDLAGERRALLGAPKCLWIHVEPRARCCLKASMQFLYQVQHSYSMCHKFDLQALFRRSACKHDSSH